MATELNTAITPTGLLGHDATKPGTVTPAAAKTLLELVKNNLVGTAAPTANEDSGDGYAVGSRWIDTTADKEYVCLDASVGAAVWTETTGGGGSSYTNLFQNGANALDIRNGVNAQTLNIYNTDDGAGNYERGYFKWLSNKCLISTEAAGTGAARGLEINGGASLVLKQGGTNQMFIGGGGGGVAFYNQIYYNIDNSKDFGRNSSGTNARPRDVYIGRHLNVAGAEITFSALPTADPVVAGRLWNNSGVVTVSAG